MKKMILVTCMLFSLSNYSFANMCPSPDEVEKAIDNHQTSINGFEIPADATEVSNFNTAHIMWGEHVGCVYEKRDTTQFELHMIGDFKPANRGSWSEFKTFALCNAPDFRACRFTEA